MKEYSDVKLRDGGTYSLFCYTCNRWIPNTINTEGKNEGYFAHGHCCVKENGKIEIISEEGIKEKK